MRRLVALAALLAAPAAFAQTPLVQLRLSGTTTSGVAVTDEAAFVRFLPNARTGFDVNDASKLFPLAATFAIIAPRGERDGQPTRLSVNSLPDGTLPDGTPGTAWRAGRGPRGPVHDRGRRVHAALERPDAASGRLERVAPRHRDRNGRQPPLRDELRVHGRRDERVGRPLRARLRARLPRRRRRLAAALAAGRGHDGRRRDVRRPARRPARGPEPRAGRRRRRRLCGAVPACRLKHSHRLRRRVHAAGDDCGPARGGPRLLLVPLRTPPSRRRRTPSGRARAAAATCSASSSASRGRRRAPT